MNNSLESNFYIKRKKFFSKIKKKFNHEDLTQLIAAHKIKKNISKKLVNTAKKFFFASKKYNFKNMTPNGMLLPKKEIEKIYSNFVEAFRDLLLSMNLEQNIAQCYLPVIRYKEGKESKKNKKRATRSELPHADCWAGWPSNSILLQIPLYGDVKNNRVSYYSSPKNLKKKWLRKTDFLSAQKMCSEHKLLNHHYKIGYIYVSDITVLHATKRAKNSQGRLSVDIPILIKPRVKSKSKIYKTNEISIDSMKKINKSFKLYAPLKMGEIDGVPGVKPPSTCVLRKI